MSIFCFIGHTLMGLFEKKLAIGNNYLNKKFLLFIHQKMSLSGFEKEKLFWRE